jgi:hypothetical protein
LWRGMPEQVGIIVGGTLAGMLLGVIFIQFSP